MQSVKVLCRIRPTQNQSVCVLPSSSSNSVLVREAPLNKLMFETESFREVLSQDASRFIFDGLLPEDQCSLFENWIEESLLDMLSGRNLCVIALGAGHSGKSYTMRGGDSKRRGILLRSVEKLLSVLAIQSSSVELRSRLALVSEGKSVSEGEISISKTSEFHKNLHKTLKLRRSLGRAKHSSHLVASLITYKNGQLLAQADFVEMGTFDEHFKTGLFEKPSNSVLRQALANTFEASRSSVVVICCVHPEEYTESRSAIEYAHNLKKKEPPRSKTPGKELLVREDPLKNQISKVENELSILKHQIKNHSRRNSNGSILPPKAKVLTERVTNEKIELQKAMEKCQKFKDAYESKKRENAELKEFLEDVRTKSAKDMESHNDQLKRFLNEKEAYWKEFHTNATNKIAHLNEEVQKYKAIARERSEETMRAQKQCRELQEKYEFLEQNITSELGLRVNCVLQAIRESMNSKTHTCLNSLRGEIQQVLHKQRQEDEMNSQVEDDTVDQSFHSTTINNIAEHLADLDNEIKEDHLLKLKALQRCSALLEPAEQNRSCESISQIQALSESLECAVLENENMLREIRQVNIENHQLKLEKRELETEYESVCTTLEKTKENAIETENKMIQLKEQVENLIEDSDRKKNELEKAKLEILNLGLEKNEIEIYGNKLKEELQICKRGISNTRVTNIQGLINSLCQDFSVN